MAGIRTIITLAFGCSFGIAFLILACVIPQPNNWLPLTLLAFYLISPIPFLIARRQNDFSSFDSSTGALEVSLFVTTFLIVSAFGLPIVLAHAKHIAWAGAAFSLAANVVVFVCIVVCLALLLKSD